MNTQPDRPSPQPIIEPWRLAVIVMILGGAMLFVHAIVPAGASTRHEPIARTSAFHATERPYLASAREGASPHDLGIQTRP
jgi:uncharacterized protein YcsI (UPF0317 family)